MKVGIYTGSFNPVHIGHLALANYLCEFEGLDEVWFMVSPRNPFKQEDELMDDALRLELVRLAVEGYHLALDGQAGQGCLPLKKTPWRLKHLHPIW